MATIKGKWVLNSTINMNSEMTQNISFNTGFYEYSVIEIAKFVDLYSLRYGKLNQPTEGIYNTDSNTFDIIGHRYIDFGNTPQEVTEEFYQWFTENAVVDDGRVIKKGDYVFNEVIIQSYRNEEYIPFTFSSYFETLGIDIFAECIGINSRGNDGVIGYAVSSTTPDLSSYGVTYPLNTWAYDPATDGWTTPTYRNITVTNDTTVFSDFYTWFTTNTKQLVTVTYNDNVIAKIEPGITATLNCAGKQMATDISITAPEVEEANLQEKTITENGEVTPDEGYDGLSKVTVDVPIPDGYIVPTGTKEITENGTHNVTEFANTNVNVPIITPKYYGGTVIITNKNDNTTDDTTGDNNNIITEWEDTVLGTWVFNNIPSSTNIVELSPNAAGNHCHMYMDFTCNGIQYTKLELQDVYDGSNTLGYSKNILEIIRYEYYDTDGVYQSHIVYDRNNGGWIGDAYKTITITRSPYIEQISGKDYNLSPTDDINYATFKRWLKASATKTTPILKIAFNINDKQYIADDGMTWMEWVNTKYNTDGFTVSGTSYYANVNIPNTDGSYLGYYKEGNAEMSEVDAGYEIIAGRNYVTYVAPPVPPGGSN